MERPSVLSCGICLFSGLASLIVLFAVFSFWTRPAYATATHTKISEWNRRNAHLVPNEEEKRAIVALNQDYSIPWRTATDSDGDGVDDVYDPSPMDWRENGYDPFAVLAFLSWYHDWNAYKYNCDALKKVVDLMKDAGVGMVRFDFLWQDIEPRPGEWDFEKYDYIVNLLTERQVRILGILGYSVSWAGKAWNYPPYDDETFVRYVRQVISRYKNKIKYWEIWNEPDSRTYWVPQDDMKRYTELLKKVYEAAKAADPSCKIVLGGMTNSGYYAIKNVYRNGGKDYFDVVNIHPFANPLRAGAMTQVLAICRNVRREMDKNGDQDKKIWITEIGAPGVERPNKDNAWWEGISPTEKQQAAWAGDVYERLTGLDDVEKVFWAFFRDNLGHFKSGVDFFGLVRWDFTPKPSFYAYKKCSHAVMDRWRLFKGEP